MRGDDPAAQQRAAGFFTGTRDPGDRVAEEGTVADIILPAQFPLFARTAFSVFGGCALVVIRRRKRAAGARPQERTSPARVEATPSEFQ